MNQRERYPRGRRPEPGEPESAPVPEETREAAGGDVADSREPGGGGKTPGPDARPGRDTAGDDVRLGAAFGHLLRLAWRKLCARIGPSLRFLAWMLAAAGAYGLGVATAPWWPTASPPPAAVAPQPTPAPGRTAELEAALEEARQRMQNLRMGQRQLRELFDRFGADWNHPPPRPRYQQAGSGVIVFWDDGMVHRKYYLYRASGADGTLKRYNVRPDEKMHYFFDTLEPGRWRFAVTALDEEGKETAFSEALTLYWPLEDE